MTDIDKQKRIKKEKTRLCKIYKDIEGEKKAVVQGLIERTANLRITLEDFEKDLDENGFVEMFKQGKEQEPYARKRPVADMYSQYSALYQKATKQLTDLLPKTTAAAKVPDTEFESFIAGRSDE